LSDPAALDLDRVGKSFGASLVVDGISLAVQPGEFLTLLGPSGCGKTTTLNLIAGFLAPDEGAIRIDGRQINAVPVHRRDIGLVFQDYALFPHRTVAENVAFGLRMRGIGRAEIAQRVQEALALVQLAGLGTRRPGQLSGGQRQRVALARALVIRPSVLLLDEPLSNLDLKLREDMRVEISGLQRKLGITTILVTHDQGEALVMSSRVAVMHKGRIAQIADPATIYARPADRFVAEFIGAMNFLPCQSSGVGVVTCQGARLTPTIMPADPALLAFRPERARLTGEAPANALRLHGRVERHAFLGGRTEFALLLQDGTRCLVEVANDGQIAAPLPGTDIAVWVAAADCLIFPKG
jgi:putative spermidine/putrescine transport system ATP-binding protein